MQATPDIIKALLLTNNASVLGRSERMPKTNKNDYLISAVGSVKLIFNARCVTNIFQIQVGF